MAVDAVFLHEDGYKYNQVYLTRAKFLTCLKRLKNASFVNAVDFDLEYIVYPSNLPEYRVIGANRRGELHYRA